MRRRASSNDNNTLEVFLAFVYSCSMVGVINSRLSYYPTSHCWFSYLWKHFTIHTYGTVHLPPAHAVCVIMCSGPMILTKFHNSGMRHKILKALWKSTMFKSPRKIVFLGKIFFGCTFHWGQMYVFEISIKRRIFDTPSTYSKKKGFPLIEESLCTFYELESPKCKHHSIFCKKVFFINRSSIFIDAPVFYARHLGVKITGPYCVYLWLRSWGINCSLQNRGQQEGAHHNLRGHITSHESHAFSLHLRHFAITVNRCPGSAFLVR